MNPVVEVQNLRKVYPISRLALSGISLTIEERECVALIGLNGAGKTTLLNILMGFLPPSSGQVQVMGHPPGSAFAKRTIGYLPEFFFAPPHLTVSKYLSTLCHFYPNAGRQEEVLNSLATRLHFWEHMDKRIGSLSKGLLRRVGIIRCLTHSPDLILLDEPDWALDPVGRKTLTDILREFRGSRTMLISSHVLDVAEDVCDRFLLLHRGKIVREIQREELLSGDFHLLRFLQFPEEMLREVRASGWLVAEEEGSVTLRIPSEEKDRWLPIFLQAGAKLEESRRDTKTLTDLLEEAELAGILE